MQIVDYTRGRVGINCFVGSRPSCRRRAREKEGVVKRIQSTIEAQEIELEGLKQTREATGLQVDALQKRQAEMLEVINDIDAIQSAIPARRQELKDLEEKITDKKPVLSVAVALESILKKTPPDRKTLIHWLEFGGISKSFQSTDEMARKTIIELLAKEGYVPETELNLPRATMQRNFENQKDLTKLWFDRATKKSKNSLNARNCSGRLTQLLTDRGMKSLTRE